MDRAAFVLELAQRLCADSPGHPLRVGIDGLCGVGKSTLALELVQQVRHLGRPAVHLDSDGFHHVRAIRHRRGADSGRGYYEDAYDFAALRELALLPLGPGGTGTYASRIHDLATDAVVHEHSTASPHTVVVFAATFIQRGALRDCWDEVVYLDAPESVARSRGVRRDSVALGGAVAAGAAYDSRYLAACRIYLDEERPRERASVLVDHADPVAPIPLRWTAEGAARPHPRIERPR